MDPALTAAVITLAAFGVRQTTVVGRAFLRAAAAFVRQLPEGTCISVRFGGAGLTLLIVRPRPLTDRSEPERDR